MLGGLHCFGSLDFHREIPLGMYYLQESLKLLQQQEIYIQVFLPYRNLIQQHCL